MGRLEYNRLLEAKNAAEENTIFAYQKKKGLVAEKRMVRRFLHETSPEGASNFPWGCR